MYDLRVLRRWLRRIPPSGILRRVAPVRIDGSQEHITSISPILVTLIMEAIRSSETSALTRATWRNIPEHGILQMNAWSQIINRRGHLKKLRHSSGDWTLGSHWRDLGQIPGRLMWNLWWTKGIWVSFLRVLRLPMPVAIPPTAA
jgi:hypothetical protein